MALPTFEELTDPSVYQEHIAIDRSNLQWEMERQPQLFMMYSHAYIDAQDEQGTIKDRMDAIVQQTMSGVRNDPEGYELGPKPTEGAIKTAVDDELKVNDNYLTLKKRLKEISHTLGVLQSAKNSLEHKRRMLREINQDNITFFYSTGPIPKDRPGQDEAKTRGQKQGLNRSLRK